MFRPSHRKSTLTHVRHRLGFVVLLACAQEHIECPEACAPGPTARPELHPPRRPWPPCEQGPSPPLPEATDPHYMAVLSRADRVSILCIRWTWAGNQRTHCRADEEATISLARRDPDHPKGRYRRHRVRRSVHPGRPPAAWPGARDDDGRGGARTVQRDARSAGRARGEADRTLVEVPPGRPQIAYYERGDQWTPRGPSPRIRTRRSPPRRTAAAVRSQGGRLLRPLNSSPVAHTSVTRMGGLA